MRPRAHTGSIERLGDGETAPGTRLLSSASHRSPYSFGTESPPVGSSWAPGEVAEPSWTSLRVLDHWGRAEPC